MRRRSEATREPTSAPATAETKGETAPPEKQDLDVLLREAATHLDLRPGEKLLVTLGPQKFFPVKFNGFEVGPFAAELTVREGETGEQTFLRAHSMLSRLDEAEFALSWDRCKQRLRKIEKER